MHGRVRPCSRFVGAPPRQQIRTYPQTGCHHGLSASRRAAGVARAAVSSGLLSSSGATPATPYNCQQHAGCPGGKKTLHSRLEQSFLEHDCPRNVLAQAGRSVQQLPPVPAVLLRVLHAHALQALACSRGHVCLLVLPQPRLVHRCAFPQRSHPWRAVLEPAMPLQLACLPLCRSLPVVTLLSSEARMPRPRCREEGRTVRRAGQRPREQRLQHGIMHHLPEKCTWQWP